MKLTRKTLVIGGAALVVVAVGGFFAYRHFNAPSTPTGPAGVNLAPATAEEKAQSETSKDQIVHDKQNQPSTSPATTSDGKKQVSVIITSADANNVSSYVSGVFEEGGTCTATFTQGGTTVTRAVHGFQNVSYTQCAPINPNLPSGGKWSVVVSYSSSTAGGQSTATNF